MGAEYNRFAVGAQKASTQVSKAVQTQTERVAAAAKGVGGMGGEMRKVKPKMDEFTGGILNITKHLGKWISFNLTWFATWRLMWTALRWLKAGVAAIVDFDTAITALGAVTAATQEQLLSLEDTARDVGATTRFTAVEVAEAMVDLSKAGFSVSEVNRMISGTALLAIGTLSDLTQTTQLVAVTLRTFHLEASEAAMVANVFAAAITNSRLTIDSLRNSLKYIGPIMAEMGYTINDTAAVLGVLADRGIEAGISARGLRGFFSALIAVTPKLKKELDKVGLSVSEVSPLTNDLAVILTRLKQAGFDVTSAMRGLERRVGTTAIALISAADYFEILRDAITATTAAEVIAEMQTESLGYRLILLRSQATELALDFRDVFLPSIQGLLSALSSLLIAINEVTSRLVELLNLFPPWARQLIIIAGILVTITTAVGLFSSGLGKGVGLIGLFTAGAGLMYGKIIAGAKAFGIWGLAIAGIVIGLTYLISRIRAAREATTEHRKEVAAQLLSLQKQRTELARVAVTLETYREDEEKLRRVLEGLADTYPEIATLLMKEHVTYEEAIGVVNRLLEVKEKEAEVRRKDVVEAIEAEIETLEKSITSVEESAARIDAALPILKQFLQIWFWIKEGTFDADKALKLLNERLGKAEERLRTITDTGREAARSIEEQLEAFEELGPTALYWYQLIKKSGRTYLFLLDAAIEEQRREFHTIQETWEALDRKGKMQKGLSEDELKQYEDSYKALEKARGQLEALETDRRKFAEAREKAEVALLAAIDKRAFTEVELYKRLIDFTKLDLAGYKDRLRLVGQLTEEEKKQRDALYKDLIGYTEKYTSAVIEENIKQGVSQEKTIGQVTKIWENLAKYVPSLWGKVARIITLITKEVTEAYEKELEKRQKAELELSAAMNKLAWIGYDTSIDTLKKTTDAWLKAGVDREKVEAYITLFQAVQNRKQFEEFKKWSEETAAQKRKEVEEREKAELELTEAMNELSWINYDTSIDSLKKTVVAWMNAGVDREKIEAYLTLFQAIENRKQFEQFKKWSDEIAAQKRKEVEEREKAERQITIEILKLQGRTTEAEQEELKERIVAWMNAGVEIEKIIEYINAWQQSRSKSMGAAWRRLMQEMKEASYDWYSFFKGLLDSITDIVKDYIYGLLTGWKDYYKEKREIDKEYAEELERLQKERLEAIEDYNEDIIKLEGEKNEDLEKARKRYEKRLADLEKRKLKAIKAYNKKVADLEKKKNEDLTKLKEKYEKDLTKAREDLLDEEEDYREDVEELEKKHKERLKKLIEKSVEDAREALDELYDWRKIRLIEDAKLEETVLDLIAKLEAENIADMDEAETKLHDKRLERLYELRDETFAAIQEETETFEEAMLSRLEEHNKTTDAILDRINELTSEYNESVREIQSEFTEAMRELAEAHREVMTDIAESIAELTREYFDRIQEIEINFAKRMQEIEKRHAETIDKLEKEIAKLRDEYEKRLKEIEEAHKPLATIWDLIKQKALEAIAAIIATALVNWLLKVLGLTKKVADAAENTGKVAISAAQGWKMALVAVALQLAEVIGLVETTSNSITVLGVRIRKETSHFETAWGTVGRNFAHTTMEMGENIRGFTDMLETEFNRVGLAVSKTIEDAQYKLEGLYQSQYDLQVSTREKLIAELDKYYDYRTLKEMSLDELLALSAETRGKIERGEISKTEDSAAEKAARDKDRAVSRLQQIEDQYRREDELMRRKIALVEIEIKFLELKMEREAHGHSRRAKQLEAELDQMMYNYKLDAEAYDEAEKKKREGIETTTEKEKEALKERREETKKHLWDILFANDEAEKKIREGIETTTEEEKKALKERLKETRKHLRDILTATDEATDNMALSTRTAADEMVGIMEAATRNMAGSFDNLSREMADDMRRMKESGRGSMDDIRRFIALTANIAARDWGQATQSMIDSMNRVPRRIDFDVVGRLRMPSIPRISTRFFDIIGRLRMPSIPSFDIGGLVQSLQRGGEVLAALHPGEWVIPKETVDAIRATRRVPTTLIREIGGDGGSPAKPTGPSGVNVRVNSYFYGEIRYEADLEEISRKQAETIAAKLAGAG